MKIFELTQLKEAVDPAVIEKIKKAIDVYKRTVDSAAVQSTDPENSTNSGDPEAQIIELANKVKSGEAQLSKDIDAQLGKTGLDADKMHTAIYSIIVDAARPAGRAIADKSGRKGSMKIKIIKSAQQRIRAAAYGYMNKKYLGGDADNFKGNTKQIIADIMKKLQPKGGAQPIGQQSSARPAGQRGTVPSGGGTNALDAMADNP